MSEPQKKSGKWVQERGKRPCRFCVSNTKTIDYKDVDTLKRFISDRGKILSRRITKNCTRHQRQLTRAIKRARVLALLSFTSK
jgi:small subunit ribosomal protein S18